MDNSNNAVKVGLRAYFLKKYHYESPPRVIDACQGDGLIWSFLRRHFKIGSYWGLDVKRRSGRMHIDSARVLEQAGWQADVVDIDTYGIPWYHWQALLPNAPLPLTVFMTHGKLNIGQISQLELWSLGLPFPKLSMSMIACHRLKDMAEQSLLSMAGDHGIAITEAREASAKQNVRYVGLRLERMSSAHSV